MSETASSIVLILVNCEIPHSQADLIGYHIETLCQIKIEKRIQTSKVELRRITVR